MQRQSQRSTAQTTAVIVDDEPMARERIRRLLETDSTIRIVSECDSGEKAVEVIRALAPDLVFLDVQMPGMGGLDVVRELGPEELPYLIFVTGHEEFAVQAFEANAVDYLLKPFRDERFWTAVERARARLRESGATPIDALHAWLNRNGPETRQPWRDRIAVKLRGEYHFVRVADIERVEAADNYVSLHTAKNAYLVRETLTRFAATLDPAQFVRVRGSSVVNIDMIESIRAWSGNEYEITLSSGTVVRSTKAYREAVRGLLA